MTAQENNAPPKPPSRVGQYALFAVLGVTAIALIYFVVRGPDVVEPPVPSDADTSVTTQRPPPSPASFLAEDAIGFAPIEVDTEGIAAARAHLVEDVELDKEAVEHVLGAFFTVNLDEASGASPAVRRRGLTSMTIRTKDFYGRVAKPGMHSLVTQTFPRFEAALAKLQAAAANSKQPIEALIKEDGDTHKEALGWAGGFVLLARSTGLMDENGAILPRLKPIVELLYRYRWYTALSGSLDPKELLTRDEYVAMTLWRLHEARGTSVRQRLRYIFDLGALIPTYPKAAAEGVVYAEADLLQQARPKFVIAVENQPELEARMARYTDLLDEKASQTPPKPAPDVGDQ